MTRDELVEACINAGVWANEAELRRVLDTAEPIIRAEEQAKRRPREYVVQIGHADAMKLSAFATKPNGAIRMGNRLTVEAVEGGGLLIRTKPVGLDIP